MPADLITQALAKVAELRASLNDEERDASGLVVEGSQGLRIRNAAPALLDLVACLLREQTVPEGYGPETDATYAALRKFVEGE